MRIRAGRFIAAALLAIAGTAWPTLRGMAQVPSGPHAGEATVEGVVYDSLARRPLVGAAVSLVSTSAEATSYSAISDSSGHYALHGVIPGLYTAGFLHPLLDSIGIEAPAHRVTITNTTTRTRVDLGVPGAQRLHDAICGAPTRNDSSGVFVGHVQNAATKQFSSDATVLAQWTRVGIIDGRLKTTLPTLAAKTAPGGWFAFCGLPTHMSVAIIAASGADSSGVLMIDVPPRTAVHRNLYVGQVEHVTPALADSTLPDSLRVPMEAFRRGPARIHGVVRDAEHHVPLPGVRLTIVGTGMSTTTDDQGAFSLRQLPLGTQALSARKVGYFPLEQPVDVFADDDAPIDLALPTLGSVMDTVRITASRVITTDANGFYRRQKTGFGRYFDADQISNIKPFRVSDLLWRAPGVRVTTSGGDRNVLVRAPLGGYCTPSLYLDGFPMHGMGIDDLDMLVPPDRVQGIEIYNSPTNAPAEFISPFAQCGAIVVWTQSPRRVRRRH